jgi:adenine-specific DNA glycosylase
MVDVMDCIIKNQSRVLHQNLPLCDDIYMNELHQWFFLNRRQFPWREDRNPYKVWVSEVMLQQTRASVVVSYFLGWSFSPM